MPLGGSRHGLLCKMLSTGLAFGFVCLWHGGHDYLQYWALMNWVGVLVENALKSFFASSFIHAILVSLKSIYIQTVYRYSSVVVLSIGCSIKMCGHDLIFPVARNKWVI